MGTDQLLSASSKTNIVSNNSKDTNSQKTNYSYDAAGNPTLISTQQRQDSKAQTQRQFSYGARGQLTQIIDKNQTTDYRYNHAMQRVSKTISNDEQRYLWQQGLLDAEINVRDNQESLTRRYIYIGLRPIAMIDYDKEDNPSIYTIHTDHLGTTQQVSNEVQEIVWQGEYDAFGQVTVKAVFKNNTTDIQSKKKGWLPTLMNGANAAESTTNEMFEFNLRFAGQYEDSESGYYYNWHRYYNPETGRYLTSDPIGLNGGLNTYSYAGQNPLQLIDPWGLYSVSSGGRTTFYTDFEFLEEFSIPTIPGWEDYKTTDKVWGLYDAYHKYNLKHVEKGLTTKQQRELEQYIIDHPTPNTKVKPAREGFGVYNLATPDVGPVAWRGWLGGIKPHKNIPISEFFYKKDYVYSFVRKGTNGRNYVVNVTAADHSFDPCRQIRTVKLGRF